VGFQVDKHRAVRLAALEDEIVYQGDAGGSIGDWEWALDQAQQRGCTGHQMQLSSQSGPTTAVERATDGPQDTRLASGAVREGRGQKWSAFSEDLLQTARIAATKSTRRPAQPNRTATQRQIISGSTVVTVDMTGEMAAGRAAAGGSGAGHL
jgi:hypothetical protein